MVIKEIKQNLSDEKGGAMIWFMIMVVAFVGISALVMDFGNLYIKSKQVKQAINRSVKAGTLAILEGDSLANGSFVIDDTQAENNFKLILAHNLGLDETTLEPLSKSVVSQAPIIREFSVENSTPTTYTSSALGKDFDIEHPSVIAVVEVKIRGIFIQRTIRVSKLSSSQLTSIYD